MEREQTDYKTRWWHLQKRKTASFKHKCK